MLFRSPLEDTGTVVPPLPLIGVTSPIQLELKDAFNQAVNDVNKKIDAVDKSNAILDTVDARAQALSDVINAPQGPRNAVAAIANESNIAAGLGTIAPFISNTSGSTNANKAMAAEDAKAKATQDIFDRLNANNAAYIANKKADTVASEVLAQGNTQASIAAAKASVGISQAQQAAEIGRAHV